MLDAADEVRAQSVGCAEALDTLHPLRQLFEKDVYLHPGELRAETEMGTAAPERDVRVRGALDVEPERIVEHVFVAIRRDVVEGDLVAVFDRLTAEFEVSRGVAAEVHDRCRPPEDLFGHAGGASVDVA